MSDWLPGRFSKSGPEMSQILYFFEQNLNKGPIKSIS